MPEAKPRTKERRPTANGSARWDFSAQAKAREPTVEAPPVTASMSQSFWHHEIVYIQGIHILPTSQVSTMGRTSVWWLDFTHMRAKRVTSVFLFVW